jgi:hypothetical protein
MGGPNSFVDVLLRLHGLVKQWVDRCSAQEEERLVADIEALRQKDTSDTLDGREKQHAFNELQNLQDFQQKRRGAATQEYADLIFAYAYARLGATDLSNAQLQRASASLDAEDPIHRLLLQAFRYRIEQACTTSTAGPLPAEWHQSVEMMAKKDVRDLTFRYKIDRLRSRLKILEPIEKVNPYRYFMRPSAAQEETQGLTDPKEVAKRIERLLKNETDLTRKLNLLADSLVPLKHLERPGASELLISILDIVDTLPRSADVRELAKRHDLDPRNAHDYKKTSAECTAVKEEYHELDELRARMQLTEKAVQEARELQSVEITDRCIHDFLGTLAIQHGENPLGVFTGLPHSCAAASQQDKAKLERFLQRTTDLIYQGRSLAALKAIHGSDWLPILAMLQDLADAQLSIGRINDAVSIMDETEEMLVHPTWRGLPIRLVKLALCYIHSLSAAPRNVAIDRLFRLMASNWYVGDRMTSNSHYCESRLQVIEALVVVVIELARRASSGADQPVILPA